MALGPKSDAAVKKRIEKKFYGNAVPWGFTHIHLMSGRYGVVVDSHNGQVTMQDSTGRQEIFEQDRLHLSWAPLNSDSQGEQA
ncbi:hypothetical protein WP8S18E11_20910 [Aeromonas veronii]|nr:hypothetical protein WP8S18E11_20910 [Aeromonas veronii]